MKKESFELLLGLTHKQPWLASKAAQLYSVLFEECPCEQSRTLIFEILDRFTYIDSKIHRSNIKDLALELATEPGITSSDTQIVAMSADSNADSSQEVIYHLKPEMESQGWRDHKVVNRFSHAFKTYKESGHKNIILVDDFIGSGKTVIGRVTEIQRQFKHASITDYSIRVKALTSTQQGLKNITDEGINVTAQRTLKKGIDDYYDAPQAQLYREMMQAMESILSKMYNDREMPSLGYNDAQATYCREESNTPNSVFPIFWWPFKTDGSERRTLLIRAMGDA